MKKKILFIVAPFVVLYLAGVFIAGDINSNNWDYSGKVVIAFISLFISAVMFLHESENNNNT